MQNINLIPAPRRAAKRRRVHLRRCMIGCAAWAALSAGAVCLAHAVWRVEDPQAGERLARVNDEIVRTERALSDVRLQLAKAQSSLRGNEAIAAQPDWSILLALLGKVVGEDVVLKNTHVRPGTTVRGAVAGAPRPDARGAATPPAADSVPYILEATGLAENYPAANKFVLRLEASGLFSKVTLLDTAKESFMEKNKTAFRLECTLDQSPVREEAAASATGKRPSDAASSGPRKSGRPRGNGSPPAGGAAARG